MPEAPLPRLTSISILHTPSERESGESIAANKRLQDAGCWRPAAMSFGARAARVLRNGPASWRRAFGGGGSRGVFSCPAPAAEAGGGASRPFSRRPSAPQSVPHAAMNRQRPPPFLRRAGEEARAVCSLLPLHSTTASSRLVALLSDGGCGPALLQDADDDT